MATGIPTTTRAGDTLNFSVISADYPPSAGWALGVSLKNVGNAYTASGTASGDGYSINIGPAVTAPWVPGRYMLSWWVSRGAGLTLERHTLGVQAIVVLPDATTASPSDGRSFARRALDAIEAVIEQRAGRADLEYRINDRQVKHIPPLELMQLRTKLRAEVKAEDNAATLSAGGSLPSRKVFVRFGR
ncbi:hypothetical protein [Curvibacter microcysteis]|nr:hypothetical protein [Curvibacter sp. HBC28]